MQDVKRVFHIGKTAQFTAHLIFIDVINIPFVTGNFRIKWKFKQGNSSGSHEHSHLNEESIEWPTETLSRSTTREDSASKNKSSARETIKLKRVNGNEAKGTTEPARLKTHVATFNRLVSCPVSMNISKTGALEACPIKLIVRQELHSETGKIEDYKLGAVSIDLSDFVSDSSFNPPKHRKIMPHRFLLAESKTNAILRVHIELEYVGGGQSFLTRGQQKQEERLRQASSASGSGSTGSNLSNASDNAG